MTVSIESIRPGARLSPVVRFPTPSDLVRYSGAARDFSAIHYDVAEARRRGFPDVIVHGFLKAAFLAEMACAWAGGGAWFRRFSAEYRGIDIVGNPIVCRAEVAGVELDERRVALQLWTENPAGHKTTKASGVLQLEGEDNRE